LRGHFRSKPQNLPIDVVSVTFILGGKALGSKETNKKLSRKKIKFLNRQNI
jgi:hypothetical protein